MESELAVVRALLAAMQSAALRRRSQQETLDRQLAQLDEQQHRAAQAGEERGAGGEDETSEEEATRGKRRSALLVKRRFATAQMKQLLRQLEVLRLEVVDEALRHPARHTSLQHREQERENDVPGFSQSETAGAWLKSAVQEWATREEVEELLELEGIELEALHAEESSANSKRSQLMAADEALLSAKEAEGAEGWQPAKLRAVITALREIEAGLQFQTQLLQDVDAAVIHSGSYSPGNFAYGSTPLISWNTVFAHPEVVAGVENCLAQELEYVVWGSSLGWLAFYAALSRGLDSVGYELLPSMVATAQELAKENQVEGVRFLCSDMLSSDLSRAGIVMLANQCWDEDLMHLAGVKLAAELRPGAVVIEYTGALAPLLGPAEVAIEVEVSWNSRQMMHVYRQRATSASSCH